MDRHADRHPTEVVGCFACKLRTISFAASAMPSRAGGARAAEVNATERRWHEDMDAYKRLRRDGEQPPDIDGAARLEAHADSRLEIEMGRVFPDAERPAIGIAADMGIIPETAA